MVLSVLQCVAAHLHESCVCDMVRMSQQYLLQPFPNNSCVLQCVAECCSVLYCIYMSHIVCVCVFVCVCVCVRVRVRVRVCVCVCLCVTGIVRLISNSCSRFRMIAVCCSVLQCVAVCCIAFTCVISCVCMCMCVCVCV